MITLAILNRILQWFDWILLHTFSGFANWLSTLGTNFATLQLPSTYYDFLLLMKLFLPMGTVLVLFHITCALISLGIVLALLHFLAHILGII